MRWRVPVLLIVMMLAACRNRHIKPVEDVGGGHDVSQFTLTSINGTRDGDRLDVRAVFGSAGDELKLTLHFTVTPPTQLQSGTWTGLSSAGTVTERSVTFLGGQSGPPSIGGRFDLIAATGAALYRVNIPLQPLTKSF
jgi:hypothetical protein